MKIEIGESLIYSWLRHVKKCQIVQTNWKPSPKWPKAEVDFEALKVYIQNEFLENGYDIFGKTASISQFFLQAEIDAVGFSLNPEFAGQKYYLADVAFHEGGLNYGSPNTTISRVLKKFIRSYFVSLAYFKCPIDMTMYFISPKMHINTILIPLNKQLEVLKDIFKNYGFSPDFQLLVNDDFNIEVLTPIVAMSNDVADTSELFLRSVQLWKMFEGTKANTNKEQKFVSEHVIADVIVESTNIDTQGLFEKIGTIKKWAENPNQINHKMIRAYLDLEKYGPVYLYAFKDFCLSRHKITKFNENFASMKTDAGHCHGKVFYQDGKIVKIYPIVREEIRRWFNP